MPLRNTHIFLGKLYRITVNEEVVMESYGVALYEAHSAPHKLT